MVENLGYGDIWVLTEWKDGKGESMVPKPRENMLLILSEWIKSGRLPSCQRVFGGVKTIASVRNTPSMEMFTTVK